MTEVEDEGQIEPDYKDRVYGGEPDDEPILTTPKKTTFAPWHHPIKQIVRDYQWGNLTERLVKERPEPDRDVLRYFTLPGSDLLDVRVISKALEKHKSKIEYFGFNVGYKPESDKVDLEATSTYFSVESALRQAGRTTSAAVILPDRLEDIADTGSQAANRLRQQPVFDVINIDACDHLGFIPEGRAQSLFDAVETLLAHQLTAKNPWLLFLTTRADPDLLGAPAVKLQSAITDNLKLYPDEFGNALAKCIEGSIKTIIGDISKTWSSKDEKFLKLFTLGLAKHMLQFFHGQRNLPANVELVSSYAYRVHGDNPDMLSIAFRITPGGVKVQAATAGKITEGPQLELKGALAAAERVLKLWILETGIEDDGVKFDAVAGTIDLLESANYDIPAWEIWLADHKIRPMKLDK